MSHKDCIAMILAGGKGTRLAALTTEIPKPAIPFGGRNRLIDFTLSNCCNSGIDTAGVLTSSSVFALSPQIGSGFQNRPHSNNCSLHTLPPKGLNRPASYAGTANAIFENIDFIEKYNPEYILVLSGDHVYKMDYNLLLEFHKQKGADATISVIEVPWNEASRFGILATQPDGAIYEFAEKPELPKSNLASMGVYIFSWSKLKQHLELDGANVSSSHDFGKNIIPAMLDQGEKVFAYSFAGYWKDVGTVESLYEAHMDLLSSTPAFDIRDKAWPIYDSMPVSWQQKVVAQGLAGNRFIKQEHSIHGEIEGSIVFPGAYICEQAKVKDSVIMPGAYIGLGAYVERAIVGPDAVIGKGCKVLGGIDQLASVAVIREKVIVSALKRELIPS